VRRQRARRLPPFTNVIPAPRVPEGHERDQAGTHARSSLLSRRIMQHHPSLLLRRRIIMAYREKTPAVYILASKRNGRIYTGVTSDLYIRMPQHKQGLIEGFTKKYHVHMLVYYEMHHLMTDAIRREHRIMEWRRQWKIRLIESMNPEWIDLFNEETGEILVCSFYRTLARSSDTELH
jgi:putative endonuclease